MIARSYIPTEQLSRVREADPALADAIEKLCRATMALRGPAMMMEANGSLTYAAAALAPFVTMQDAFTAAMGAKADAAQAVSARSQRKTPEADIRKGRLSPTELSFAETIALRPSRMPNDPPHFDRERRKGRAS
jgi:hypothetical protein